MLYIARVFCMNNTIFCLMGPTAAGKTTLACELVNKFPFEIISIDSAMIYRGMDIGTAKPDKVTLAASPHHLLDIINPNESYSAALCCKDVRQLIGEIRAHDKIPLLVGGTMMYFHALQQGLSLLPTADEALRHTLLQEAATNGWEYMHAKLMHIDSVSGQKIHPHDTQRIQRALEVYYLSGEPLSVLIKKSRAKTTEKFVNMALLPTSRSWLHDNIATRFITMINTGLIAEVEAIIQQWHLTLDAPSMRCVGYRQVLDYLENRCDKTQLVDNGIAATRQLAKRQLTWLRHWPNVTVLEAEEVTRFGMARLIAVCQQLLAQSAA